MTVKNSPQYKNHIIIIKMLNILDYIWSIVMSSSVLSNEVATSCT